MRFLLLLSLSILVLCMSPAIGSSQSLRPVRDDVGFCWDATQMDRLIAYLEKNEGNTPVLTGLVGGISPHDDFLYAGRVYIPLYRSLRAREVVIFGVTHGGVRKEIGDPRNVLILDSFEKWKGPYGDVPISPLREYIRSRMDTSEILVSNKAHELEHSIEATIPFLQHYNRDLTITPIMVTAMPLDRMEELSEEVGTIVAQYIKEKKYVFGKDIVILISSDANHYGTDFTNLAFGEGVSAHNRAIEHDRAIASNDLAGPLDSRKVETLAHDLWGSTYADQGKVVWCGKYSIPFGLLTLQKVAKKVLNREVTGTVLRYSDTYTEGVIPLKDTGMGTTAPFSLRHWCGFVSVGYK
jgi:AmmeMemoRadiSam system protein B